MGLTGSCECSHVVYLEHNYECLCAVPDGHIDTEEPGPAHGGRIIHIPIYSLYVFIVLQKNGEPYLTSRVVLMKEKEPHYSN